ncbi:MAG: hypothetical protein AOA66_0605 [Candidatus Bathyarchaeota archaeon BA2]|nr:MAG: hypothetical protein AOA66_0605 [Candidatus Bathyarchaeota archaeon BA2]
MGVVKRTRSVGKALMYQIDMNNPMAKAANELAWQIAKHDAEKAAKEELAKSKKSQNRSYSLKQQPVNGEETGGSSFSLLLEHQI